MRLREIKKPCRFSHSVIHIIPHLDRIHIDHLDKCVLPEDSVFILRIYEIRLVVVLLALPPVVAEITNVPKFAGMYKTPEEILKTA